MDRFKKISVHKEKAEKWLESNYENTVMILRSLLKKLGEGMEQGGSYKKKISSSEMMYVKALL